MPSPIPTALPATTPSAMLRRGATPIPVALSRPSPTSVPGKAQTAGTYQLEAMGAQMPGQTWYLVDQPIVTPTGNHLVVLFTIQHPRHAGDDFELTALTAWLRAPEFSIAKANLSVWMRHQLEHQRTQAALTIRGPSVPAVFQHALPKIQQRLLPPGTSLLAPAFAEDALQSRKVHLGLFIGGQEVHGVPCASCGGHFTARLSDASMTLRLRLAPDGPLTTLYWCPACTAPGLASAGTLDMTHGRDGAILTE